MQFETSNKLLELTKELPGALSGMLIEEFGPLFTKAEEAIAASGGIEVTDVSQVGAMKAAREARLGIREARVNTEHARKRLKEESLRTGKAIDNVAKMIATRCEVAEAHLQALEDYAENVKAEQRRQLVHERLAVLAQYNVDTRFIDLAGMGSDDFAKLLDERRTLHEAEQVAKKTAQEEAARRAAIEAEEAKKAKAEQDRLAAIAKAEEEKQAAIEAERKRQADAIAADRLAAEQREKDRANVGRKRKEAKEALMSECGISEDVAKAVVLSIAGGKIANVIIEY